MISEARTLWLPKDIGFINEYEDAYAVDAERGLAAVADGVSSAIFSRQWAQILTSGLIESPPDMTNGASFSEWLAGLRAAWDDSIDMASLNWREKQKLQLVGGDVDEVDREVVARARIHP